MRRLALIAAREYFAYTHTVGFWLSMLSLPLLIGLSGAAPMMMARAAPQPHIAFVDLTGREQGKAVIAQLTADSAAKPAVQVGPQGMRPPMVTHLKVVESSPDLAAARTPQAADAAARRELGGEEGALDAVAILSDHGGTTGLRLWTRRAGDDAAASAIADALAEVLRVERLRALGIDPGVVKAAALPEPRVELLSPRSASGEKVELRDRLPGYVGLAAGFLLWSLVMTGAGMLMNSVIEEKSNRVLEVLLSSASTTEILFGKVLGVAGVTLTVLAVWATGAFVVLSAVQPSWIGDVASALMAGGLIFKLGLYFAGGYLMYAMVFVAVGAFCETPRDAQTLLGPVMIVLMIPLFAMQMAVAAPNAPILKTLSWIPLFTPFLMPARAPASPPLIEVVGTLLGMVAMAAVMVWIAGRAFRAGALVTGKVDFKQIIAAFRRPA
jgi:ABC-2 type transport system permease protein